MADAMETLTEIQRVVEAHLPGTTCEVVVDGGGERPSESSRSSGAASTDASDGLSSHWSVPIPAFTDAPSPDGPRSPAPMSNGPAFPGLNATSTPTPIPSTENAIGPSAPPIDASATSASFCG